MIALEIAAIGASFGFAAYQLNGIVFAFAAVGTYLTVISEFFR